jgi:hypothetical protein
MARKEELPAAHAEAASTATHNGPVSDLSGLSPSQQHALATAILAVVRGYDRIGVASFNMSMFTGPAVGFEDAWVGDQPPASSTPHGVELPLFRTLSAPVKRSTSPFPAQDATASLAPISETKWYSGGTLPPRVLRNFASTRTREHKVKCLSEAGSEETVSGLEGDDEFEFVPSETLGVTFSACVKFMSRPAPVSCYTNDSGPTERLLDTFVINSAPEDYSECLRNVWDDIILGIQ